MNNIIKHKAMFIKLIIDNITNKDILQKQLSIDELIYIMRKVMPIKNDK